MPFQPQQQDLVALNQETREIWDQNADFWDRRMGEGNHFQRQLIGPNSERLLDLKPDELVLEIACGNGVFTRQLARLGARVIASDFSEKMLERARARSSGEYAMVYAERIEYRQIDATDEAQILVLGEQRFDAAVCNMGMMDMVTIDPMLRALSKVLKPTGRFVFSIMHPCFNAGSRMYMEEEDRNGEIITVYSIKIVDYLNLKPTKGLGMNGQPAPHNYFYRPLHELFNSCFRAGFVLDALAEPALDGDEIPNKRPLTWSSYANIPPVLIARLRLA